MSEDFQDPNELTRIGLVHVQQGQFELASESFGRAVALRPDSPALWSHLGIALQYAGKSKQAIQAFRKACSLRPDSAELLSNLGNALWQAKEWTEGEAACRKAIELNPDLPDAYANLGNALMEQDRIDEAVAAFEKFVQLRPKISTGYYNLGLALNKATRSADAAAAFARAVDLNPDDFNSRNNLGCTFLFVSKPEPAAVVFESALKLRPDDAATWNNLGGALKDMGRLPEAIAAYRRAMELRPDVADFHSNLVYCLYYHEPDPEVIYNELKIWNERHCKPLRSRIVPHANERNPQRRLRVGYVSADFWDHASAFFLDPLLANHDHQQFEIFCYAQMNRIDWVTRRLQKYADSWLDTRPFGNDELARKIREDRIDILVDLKLHSGDNRLLVFAQKPAPVQVTWLGYPDSNGLDTMDYRLTDRYLEEEAKSYSMPERRVFLPDCFWCYDPLTSEPEPDPSPALAAGHITFGCLNNFSKLNDATLRLCARILSGVAGSRLILMAPEGSARERTREVLRRAGAGPELVEFVGRQSRRDYLATYRRIDIALDTYPYAGHTTSLDALWMGVPVITRFGQGPLSRGAWTQLCNLGLPDFAARDEDEYVRLAIATAQDLKRLTVLRQVLRDRMAHSPLMDGPRFTGAVESAFREMWRTFCQVKS